MPDLSRQPGSGTACVLLLWYALGPRLQQLWFSRLGVLEGGGVTLKGAELLKWAAGQNISGNATIVVDEFFLLHYGYSCV